jgi:hypothetical protein
VGLRRSPEVTPLRLAEATHTGDQPIRRVPVARCGVRPSDCARRKCHPCRQARHTPWRTHTPSLQACEERRSGRTPERVLIFRGQQSQLREVASARL